ncbi:enterobactin exporter EntS [Streptomyces sp. YIM 130001]|uniref:MFS transporter n=1 Tax=Streptomyces sp. YIM 130001 TaxID=2259644 RepID=UPI000ECAF41F|nr:MFS transporter [Streptomyces sp. YIM 130001]RII06975.1 enterobactin exporter EntS [Streptomyces sp. YIM 130001]
MAVRDTSLLTNRNFVTYWSGQAVAMAGSAVLPVALSLVAVVSLHASAMAASIVSAASMLPGMLLTLPVGAVVDRLPKRAAMMWADLGQSMSLWAVPVLWWTDLLSIAALCVIGFVATSCGIVSQVAHLSLTPYLIADRQLIDANSKLSLADSVATTSGPIFAGFLVGRLGAPFTVGLAALGSLFSAATLLRVRSSEPPPSRTGEPTTLRRDIVEGLHFVRRNVILRSLMVINAIDNFFLSWVQAVLVVYLVRVLLWSPESYGVVMGIAAVGGILGSLLVRRLHKSLGTGRLLFAAVAVGAPAESMVLFLSPGHVGQVLTCLAQMAAIFATVCYNVTSRTLRQRESPEGMRSRITAAHRWVGGGLRPVGAICGGLSTTVFDVRTGIAIGCVSMVITPVVAWLSPLRGTDLREPEERRWAA